MGLILAAIYDAVMAPTEKACLQAWRAELLRNAAGDILEIGAGTGVNLPHYGAGVRTLTTAEPDAAMRSRLEQRAVDPRARVVDWPAEKLEATDASFDVVVSTLVLCTVTDPAASLREAHRVLRPGGRLLFMEHVVAHDRPGRARWQRVVEPAWKMVAGGCHVARDTLPEIERAGFALEQVERASMRKAPSFVRPSIRGIAVKA